MVDLTQAHKASIELLGTRHTALVEAVRNYVNGSVQTSIDELIAAAEDVTTDIDTKEKMLLGLVSRQATKPVPSLILDFKTRNYLQGTRRPEKGYGIRDLLTVERSSSKWVYSASGKLVEVPAHEPAYQHDPVTGEPLGLLIEESRTNYVSLNDYGSIRIETREMVDSPLPGHPARHVTITGNFSYSFAGSVHLTSGQTVVHSVYAKATETNSIVHVGWFGGADRAIANKTSSRFDLSAGTVASTSADAIDSGIEPAGDGWYRCWTSAEATQDGEAGCCVWLQGGDGDETIWGLPQVEKDATRPSSYIPVVDEPVTRAADNVARELGDEVNPMEGTFYVEYKIDSHTRTSFTLSLGQNSDNYLGIGYNVTTSQNGVTYLLVDGVSQGYSHNVPNREEYGQWARLAVSYVEDGTLAVSCNGGFESAPISGDLSFLNSRVYLNSRLGLGFRSDDVQYRAVRYYPRALTEQELIDLTS